MKQDWDFAGWASKNDLLCADGRIIRKNAFLVNDRTRVPLTWNHKHDSVKDVLGHAILENREEGVYAYGYFNNTTNGKDAKEQVIHGDITSLSIWANNLRQEGPDVLHGVIREVSLVPAGANPGAYIESVIAHGQPMEDYDTEGIFYCGENIELAHSASEDADKKTDDKGSDKTRSARDVYNDMSEEQQKVVAYLATEIGKGLAEQAKKDDDDDDDKKGDSDMKHNMFDGSAEATTDNYLTHSDELAIINEAARVGSFRTAIERIMEEGGELAHKLDDTGMTKPTLHTDQGYGFYDAEMLFPDYRNLTNEPTFISRDMNWVSKVMGKVKHTPFSRIKSVFANITEDEARARGYIKGKQKKTEVFSLLKRTTDPTTIYKLQKLDRDDVIDITDFDVIAWIKREMRTMLDEEIARAILIGDGREGGTEEKIPEDHIRPIVTEAPLFNTTVMIKEAAETTQDVIANDTIDAIIRARKNYKGTGLPTLYTTEDVVCEMLLLKDTNGRRIYTSEAELVTALRVAEIVTVEVMEGHTVKKNAKDYPLIGILVNLADYNVGADKGGAVSMFDDFDINYNKYEYLIETRISGALVRPYSAITLLLDNQEE